MQRKRCIASTHQALTFVLPHKTLFKLVPGFENFQRRSTTFRCGIFIRWYLTIAKVNALLAPICCARRHVTTARLTTAKLFTKIPTRRQHDSAPQLYDTPRYVAPHKNLISSTQVLCKAACNNHAFEKFFCCQAAYQRAVNMSKPQHLTTHPTLLFLPQLAIAATHNL